jgi:hypothetical protein
VSYICPVCIKEPVLQKIISQVAKETEPCGYCQSGVPTVEIGVVADLCEQVIDTFYEPSNFTMAVVHFGRDPAGENLEELVESLTGIPSKAAEDVAAELCESSFDRDTHEHKYGDDPHFVLSEKSDSRLYAAWTEMEVSLRTEARYLNPSASRFMDQLFSDIDSHVVDGVGSVLVEVGPGTALPVLYRARVFQSEMALGEALQRPERELGAPPPGVGKEGGRLNSPGQPAFYGALAERTAIAEVRPPVGSLVTVTKFTITRPLKLLDLALLERAQMKPDSSKFDPATIESVHRLSMLRELAVRMTTPVMPDSQAHDYLITQVIADYLATRPGVSIDGILYPSVQVSNSDRRMSGNVVLFHKAAIAEGARNEAPTAEAELREYIDEAPGSYFSPKIKYLKVQKQPSWWKNPGFQPEPTLELVRDGIQVHEITAANFETSMTRVQVLTDLP